MRIAIVNHTVMVVEILRSIITSVPGYRIAWVASDGKSAINHCAADTPDLILMDMTMPKMDGAQATRVIMQQHPCPIIIVTPDIKKNSAKIFEAMGYGALDVVRLPVMAIAEHEQVYENLLKTIASVGIVTGIVSPRRSLSQSKTSNYKSVSHKLSYPPRHLPPLIIIGASTGGPKALATILGALPANFEGSIVIIQHLDFQFSSGLAKWWTNKAPIGNFGF